MPEPGPRASDAPPRARSGPGVPGGRVPGLLALAVAVAACGGVPVEGPAPGESAADAPADAGLPDTLPEPGIATRDAAGREILDVRHYHLRIDLRELADSVLRGHATLDLEVAPGTWRVPLDFAGLGVDSVRLDGADVPYRHRGALLTLAPEVSLAGRHEVDIFYRGTPRDGLVFAPDPAGRPTAFADNWPNRARWWFPGNDHPSDKATVRFDVRTPRGAEVVANGVLRDTAGGTWTWETVREIPTYTMVIGVADFARHSLGDAACERAPAAPGPCVNVSAWTLAGDSAYAVRRFARAPAMVDAYAERVAPFPYEKLAHVESSTRFGGMENAAAIFYAMAPWTEGRMGEGVIAHETAHQWFGDAVTPRSWHHLWLSEGFASYFGPLFFADADGDDEFRRRMAEARSDYLASDVVDRPVVDSSTVDLYSLLNENNYEKGAWVLHTLRGVVGDSAFFRGIRRYYRKHRHGTAVTRDLREAVEATSGRELGWFFEQWLRLPGHPVVDGEWWTGDGELVVALRQTQRASWPTFRLPTELLVELASGPDKRVPVELRHRADTVRVPVAGPVDAVTLDPDRRTLMVGSVVPRTGSSGPDP